jgi:hypothetical protein
MKNMKKWKAQIAGKRHKNRKFIRRLEAPGKKQGFGIRNFSV